MSWLWGQCGRCSQQRWRKKTQRWFPQMFGWERLTNQKLMKAGVFATLSNPSISNLSKARKKKQRNRENNKYFVLFHHDTCYRTAACVSPKFDIKVENFCIMFMQGWLSLKHSTKHQCPLSKALNIILWPYGIFLKITRFGAGPCRLDLYQTQWSRWGF